MDDSSEAKDSIDHSTSSNGTGFIRKVDGQWLVSGDGYVDNETQIFLKVMDLVPHGQVTGTGNIDYGSGSGTGDHIDYGSGSGTGNIDYGSGSGTGNIDYGSGSGTGGILIMDLVIQELGILIMDLVQELGEY